MATRNVGNTGVFKDAAKHNVVSAMASLEFRKPRRFLKPECIQIVLYSEYNDVAGDFEEVAITDMQYNL